MSERVPQPSTAPLEEEELAKAQPTGAFAPHLWLGILLGPFAVLANLQASYTLVHPLCDAKQPGWLFLPPVISLALIAVAGAVSLRGYRHVQDDQKKRSRERARFLSTAGVVLSAFCALVVLAMLVPKLFLGPCDR
jgi:hypothetical protein